MKAFNVLGSTFSNHNLQIFLESCKWEYREYYTTGYESLDFAKLAEESIILASLLFNLAKGKVLKLGEYTYKFEIGEVRRYSDKIPKPGKTKSFIVRKIFQ